MAVLEIAGTAEQGDARHLAYVLKWKVRDTPRQRISDRASCPWTLATVGPVTRDGPDGRTASVAAQTP